MNAVSIGGYTRISKQAARNLYNASKPVYVCSCKCRPDSVWQPAIEIAKSHDGDSFDNYTNRFEYYNCDHGRGYYAAFYTKA